MMPGNHWLGCYLKTDGIPIGLMLFLEEHEDDGQPCLGSLVIHKDYQRQKFDSEAFQCVAEYFRRGMGWSNLRAGVKAQNEVGLAFLEHLGFRLVRQGSERFTGGMQTFFVLDCALR